MIFWTIYAFKSVKWAPGWFKFYSADTIKFRRFKDKICKIYKIEKIL